MRRGDGGGGEGGDAEIGSADIISVGDIIGMTCP
eukprot:CAMPEP_0174731032 /NCGR_PEP_ID=MMETSP1094-20130205/56752_1 /TAXON_ID=156173 /ORGANISM="Chrysochromulina brevifilum, Strain UTEX LB 985" /LENGTH=33 /DNA_ID= /DNA_START= /DNA_END= /DNA_ORIENTATION=